jgi:polyisoprenoid-binding protein YceI
VTEDSAVWLDDHQQRVWRLWLEVSTTLPAVLNRQLSRDSQLSVQDFEVLVRLSETDGGEMRVVALAEHMGWERSRLSHHLTRMEKRGLIERRVSVEVAAQTASLASGNADRDAHVKSADVLDVENDPTTAFRSTSAAISVIKQS